MNAVDNEGHHIGIGKRQQKDVARRREHREKDNQRLRARDTPKPLQRAAHGGAAERAGASLRHGLPFASDRAKRHCCTLEHTPGKHDAKSARAVLVQAPRRQMQLVLVFLVCEQLRGRKPQNLVGLLGIFQRVDVLELALHYVGARGDDALDRFARGLDLLLGAA